MKTTKVLVLLTIMMMATTVVGCGTKNTEAQKNDVEVMAPVEKTVVPEEETTVEEVETETTEETFGDVDATAMELTMDGMAELVLGLDIPLTEESNKQMADFYGDEEFLILFPKPRFITEQKGGVNNAILESIKFKIDIVVDGNTKLPTSISANDGDRRALETIGNYTIYTIRVTDSSNRFCKSYDIYNNETGKTLSIVLTITKVRDYQDYCDNLVIDFVPAFEEVLYNNLQ